MWLLHSLNLLLRINACYRLIWFTGASAVRSCGDVMVRKRQDVIKWFALFNASLIRLAKLAAPTCQKGGKREINFKMKLSFCFLAKVFTGEWAEIQLRPSVHSTTVTTV